MPAPPRAMLPAATCFSRRAALAGGMAGLAALAGCDKIAQALGRKDGFRSMEITGADYARDFNLLDANGQRRTLADFRGKAVLLYFGFTQCPDLCPTALARAAEVKRQLGPEGARFVTVFITVDPARDTPELLRQYLAAFDPSFVGLCPTPEELKQTAAAFKIYYKAVPTGSSYTMNHSSQAYLYDPQGRLRLVLRPDQPVQDWTHDARMLLDSPQN